MVIVVTGYVFAMLRNLVVVVIKARIEVVVLTEANLGPGNHLPGTEIADEDPQ